MKTTDFDFNLPDHLIAKYPTKERSASRLLHLNRMTGDISHRHFYQLPDLLDKKDLLVMNSSKVIPARVFGHKDSGGKVEVLIERIISTKSAWALIRASKALNTGRILLLGDANTPFRILGRNDDLFEIELIQSAGQNVTQTLLNWLHQYGHMPLPPYMQREDETQDLERYQTVYAQQEGSVAAPTAGLHFDNALFAALRDKGIQTATLTLHVGSGTFQPVRVDDIKDHIMHKEWFSLPQETCDAIHACKARGGRVIAVGTTTVRTLESAARNNPFLCKTERDTDIFIYPGFQFQIVDAMVTNFHLPQSTLLMLVSAFSTQNNVANAYQQAIQENYRFYSYGDAMFIAS
jgi:S-adenosylmethionine:tRNA ribosyltransferase-isomerase